MNYIGEKWFDTLNTIQADCDRNLLVEAMKLCPYYDGLFNRMNPDSDLYRLNHSRGELTWVHEEVKEVLRMAQEIYEASGHTFNVAVGSLVQLWKQAAKNQRLPSQLQREQAIAEADFSKVCIENEGIQMPADMELDLGGIAKGYIVDQLAQYLRDHGVTSALLNFGGNMKTIGTRPDGTPWKIQLAVPAGKEQYPIGVIPCVDRTVVTSSCFERYFELDQKRYHHIIHPKTGCPADSGLTSVTIVTEKSSMLADALATSVFLLGKQAGIELIRQYQVEGLLVTEEGEILSSPGLLPELSD